MNAYASFCAAKRDLKPTSSGFTVPPQGLRGSLFPFQRGLVSWALGLGKAALFCECGLGKTPMQLEWAHQVARHAGGRVLILAPLAVSQQTVREGEKFGLPVRYAAEQSDVAGPVTHHELRAAPQVRRDVLRGRRARRVLLHQAIHGCAEAGDFRSVRQDALQARMHRNAGPE